MGVNSSPETATTSLLRFEPRLFAPESSTLTTRLPSHTALHLVDSYTVFYCLLSQNVGSVVDDAELHDGGR